MAMPFDTPIPGYGCDTVNTLRLWAALSSHGFNLDYFNRGDYIAAVEETSRSRSISRVLYPNDNVFSGKELRLKQEYFLVSASLQDIVRRYQKTRTDFDAFAEKVAIQLNDTHSALAIPELMRILVDLKQLSWDRAWEITVATFGYTNHTLLPEALEEVAGGVARPRAAAAPADHLRDQSPVSPERTASASGRHRPAAADVADRGIAGEARFAWPIWRSSAATRSTACRNLHSDLLRSRMFRDFDEFFPVRFYATTNGITPRRWLRTPIPASPNSSPTTSATAGFATSAN